MKPIHAFCALPVVLSLVACSAQTDDTSVDGSEADLTASVKLEKSKVRAFLDQKNTFNSTNCVVESAKFRITYENSTLPVGTTVTLHAGESFSDQEFIGDGFGFGTFHKGTWGSVRDQKMTLSRGVYSAQTTAQPYGEVFPNGDGTTHAPEIQFAFMIRLPSGRVLWDNRLNADYIVTGNEPVCVNGSTNGFIARGSWGPF